MPRTPRAIIALAAVLTVVLAAPGLARAATGGIDYLTAPSADDPLDVVNGYLAANAATLGLDPADLADTEVGGRFPSTHNGLTHIYLAQRHQGIPVRGAVVSAAVNEAGRLLSLASRFQGDLASRVNAVHPAISATMAVAQAAERLGLTLTENPQVLEASDAADQAATVSGAGISQRPIPVALTFVPGRSGELRLAWDLGIDTLDSRHYWQVQVDALSGDVLSMQDLVEQSSYRVYPLPVESPHHTTPAPPADGRTLEVDPHDDEPLDGASRTGWHLNTQTQGQNVFAQTDLDADDTPVGEVIPDGGPFLAFDFVLDLTQGPETYREAAVTNLFYWNNILHDIHAHYGFDVPSGNFEGTDPVLADAQDGSGTNNANFLTLPEGVPPRMQMFVFTPPGEVFVTAPASIAGSYEAGSAGFGQQLDATGISGAVELADDGSANGSEGCGPLVGFTPGNIAIIDRGSCEFGTKVLNAENAGAAAAIIVNNQGDAILGMAPGVDGPSVTIPSVFIGQSSGATIKGELGGGVTATVRSLPLPNRDSDLDNGIIAHEYGHGVSTRLTGGSAEFTCLQSSQSGGMGEGWGDFWAVTLTDDGSDVANSGATGRGVGTYVSFHEPDGPGIRVFPYSTDLAVNPLRYSDIAGLAVPHGVGTVWATALNDLYWDLIDRYGFDPDLYRGTGGNNLALQLVMDGLKLQPCGPTFLDARDAILLADLENNAGANQCLLWGAFARRGMGLFADDGGHEGSVAVRNDFNVPLECVTESPIANDDEAVTAQDLAVSIDVLANDLGYDIEIDSANDGEHGTTTIEAGDPQRILYTPDPGFVGFDEFVYTISDSTGGVDSARVAVEVECGGSGIDFSDGFDPAPAAGWDVETAQNATGFLSPTWTAAPDAQATSAPNSFYSDATSTDLKDDRLIAPPQPISAASKLVFFHRYVFENGFDGGVLEVSTDGGVLFRDIETAGGLFVSGGYTGTIDTGFGSPIGGRNAWTGEQPDMIQVEVNLTALAGQTAIFRWRLVTDNGFLTTGLGWWVDDVTITNLDDGRVCDAFPTALDDTAETDENVAVSIDVLANDSDPDGDPIAITAVESPTAQGGTATIEDNGTPDPADDTILYTPAAGFSGADTFAYTISDPAGNADSAVVTVTVHNVNEAPVAGDDFASTDVDTAVVIDVSANDFDPDGDPIMIDSFDATSAQGGSVSDNGDGTLTYTPPAGFSSPPSDTFEYTICDDGGLCDSATVSVTVNDDGGGEACDLCAHDKPAELTLTYRGGDCSASDNTQGGKDDCEDFAGPPPSDASVYILANDDSDADSDSDREWFRGEVGPDQAFTLQAANGDKDDFGSKVFVHIFDTEGGTLLQTIEIHTSCSAPLFEGERFGAVETGDGSSSGVCEEPSTPSGRVHGSGYLAGLESSDDDSDSDSDKINFSFDAKFKKSVLKGKLKLKDKLADVEIDAKQIDTLTTGSGSCNGTATGDGAFELTATGSFESGGGEIENATFRVCGEDNGKKGKGDANQPADRLYVECLSGCSYDTASRTPDDGIDGGNIHLHDPIVGGGGSGAAAGGESGAEAGGGDGAAAGSQDSSSGGDPAASDASSEEASGSGSGEPGVLDLALAQPAGVPTGSALALTATFDRPLGLDFEGLAVTLHWKSELGLAGSLTSVTDAFGQSLYLVTAQAGAVEYWVTAGELDSNRVDVTGLD